MQSNVNILRLPRKESLTPGILRSDRDDDEDQEYDMPHYDFYEGTNTVTQIGATTHCTNRYAGGVG